MSVYRKLSTGSTNRRNWGIPAVRSWTKRREGRTVQIKRSKEKHDWKKEET